MNTWNNLTFVELMKFDPRKAFEYRKQTLWDEIPRERMTAEELNWGKIEVVSDEEAEKTEIKRQLKEKWIKFFAWASLETLRAKLSS